MVQVLSYTTLHFKINFKNLNCHPASKFLSVINIPFLLKCPPSIYSQQVPSESSGFSRLLILWSVDCTEMSPNASAPGDNLYQVTLLPDPHQHCTRSLTEPNWSLHLGAFISGSAELPAMPAVSPYTLMAVFV
jgi:hypothetical protein